MLDEQNFEKVKASLEREQIEEDLGLYNQGTQTRRSKRDII